MRAVTVDELSGDAGFVLTECAEPMAGMDAGVAEPLAHRLIDDALQATAMDRELRHVIAGVEAARLAPDLLTETIGVEQLVSADPHRIETLQQAEGGALFDGMRWVIEADAELAVLLGLFEGPAIEAARVQHRRGGQPADAAACDDRFHGRLFWQTGSRSISRSIR